MKTTTTAARRRLRESNPVPHDAFTDAINESVRRAALETILGGQVEDAPGGPRVSRSPGSGRPGFQRPRRPRRVRWPAAVLAAAAVAALAVTAALLRAPLGGTPGRADRAALSLTYHPAPNLAAAAAVLRALASQAADQRPPALGPVVYAEAATWGLDIGNNLPYDLNYRSHDRSVSQSWMAPDGSILLVTTFANGKVPPGLIPVIRSGPSQRGRASWARYGPAGLPSSQAALRRLLLNSPLTVAGRSAAQTVMDRALYLMVIEPLPPAVQASMLRIMARLAEQNVPDARLVDLGSVTDRAGHAGVAIGYETPAGAPWPVSLQVLIFAPGTGAILGEEFAYCKTAVSAFPARGQCFPTSYDQVIKITAVPAIPTSPPSPGPSDSPVPTAGSSGR